MESTPTHLRASNPLRVLITGTGRCGTVSMARFLTSLGVPCGHESIFDLGGIEAAHRRLSGELPVVMSFISQIKKESDGQVQPIDHWLKHHHYVEADSSYMSAPFLDDQVLTSTQIVHLVRHPLAVINSFLNGIFYFGDNPCEYEKNIYRWLPEVQQAVGRLDRAALYYVLWNEMIESKLYGRDYLRYRLEDAPAVLFDYLQICPVGCLEFPASNGMAWPGSSVNLAHIQSDEIRVRLAAISTRYGYSLMNKLML